MEADDEEQPRLGGFGMSQSTRREQHTPNRFRIIFNGEEYRVSIPNYEGGEVVTAEIADQMLVALKSINEWILDTGHPIERRDLWNAKFLKAHDLAAAAIKRAEGTAR
jgi:hypothetical protein